MRAYQLEAMIKSLNDQETSLKAKRLYVERSLHGRIDVAIDNCAVLNNAFTAALDATKKMDLELEKSVRQVMDD